MMIKLPETVTGKVYVTLDPYGGINITASTMSGCEGWTVLSEQEITLDVPQEDPTAKVVEALENRAEDIQAEATAAVRVIMDQIQQLKCIEHKPEQADV